jgi:Ca2+-binding RTX toxin-like protein
MATFTLVDGSGTSFINTEILSFSFLHGMNIDLANSRSLLLSGLGDFVITGEGLKITKVGGNQLGDITDGNIRSINVFLGADSALTIGGLNLDAEKMFDLAMAGKNRAVINMMFAGSDIIVGGSSDDKVLSRSGNDYVRGQGGHDTLNGGKGQDTLIGGDGDDVFIFDSELISGNADRTDAFATGTDEIRFDNDIFTRLGPVGAVAANRIVQATAAGDSNDRLIYNASNGNLWYDPDGTGAKAKVLVAVISEGLFLVGGGFTVID